MAAAFRKSTSKSRESSEQVDKNKFMKAADGDDDNSDESDWGSDTESSSDDGIGPGRNQLDFFRIKPGT